MYTVCMQCVWLYTVCMAVYSVYAVCMQCVWLHGWPVYMYTVYGCASHQTPATYYHVSHTYYRVCTMTAWLHTYYRVSTTVDTHTTVSRHTYYRVSIMTIWFWPTLVNAHLIINAHLNRQTQNTNDWRREQVCFKVATCGFVA